MMRAGSVVVGSSNRSVAPAAEVVVVVVVEALAGGGGDLGVDVGGEPRVLRRAQPLPLPLPLAALIARRNAALQELHQAGGAVVLVQVRRPPAVVVVREAGQLEGRGGGGGEGAEVAVVVRGGGGGFWRRRGRRLVQELALQRVGEAGHVCRRRGGGAGAGAGHVHQRREVGDGRYVARLGVGRRLRAAPLACGWCCCCSCTTYDEALLEHPAQHPLVLGPGGLGDDDDGCALAVAVAVAVELGVEAVLVHDPSGLLSPGRPPRVEDERLLGADERLAPEDVPVLARGLPVPGLRGPVGPQPRRVLAVLEAEEVPLLLPHPRQRWQVPGLALVEVGLGDGERGEAGVGGLAGQVVRDELLVGRVEAEARGQLHGPVRLLLHCRASNTY
uniref:Uncharacterized protein n=1 Tax=Zea mays TaxID=4577 RepID=C4J0Z6_MAIZE|nr:unknown [Zea mays]